MIPAFVKTRPTWEMQPFVRLTYPSEKAALGLPAEMQSKARPTLDATPWFWDAWSQLARGDLPSLLERLPERPMASALLEELRTVAKEVKASQVENAVGASWAGSPGRREGP